MSEGRRLRGVALAALLVIPFAAILAASLQLDPTSPGRALFRADRPHYLWLVTRLPANLDLLLITAVFLASAIGPGDLLLARLRLPWRDEAERLLLSLAAGLAVYTFAIMALAWLGLLRRLPLLVVFAIAALLTARSAVQARARRPRLPAPSALQVLMLAGLAFLAGAALLGALGPEVQWDARWYHLGDPYHYVLHGGFFDIVRITNISAAGGTPYQELLYAGLIPFTGPIGAKLLHWWDAVLTVPVLVYFCRAHLASAGAGLLAALVFLGTPVVSWQMTTAGNDLPLALYGLICLHCGIRWLEDRRLAWLVAAGVFGGYSVGVKQFGAIALVLVGAVVLVARLRAAGGLRLGALAPAAVLAAVTLLLCVPWFVRAFQLTGDPVFPLLYHVFRTPYWDDSMQRYASTELVKYGAQHTLLGFLRLPFDLTFDPIRYRSLMGPLYLAVAPVVLVALAWRAGPRSRLVVGLAAFVLAGAILWFAAGVLEVRYADALLPPLAIVIAYSLWQLARTSRVFAVAVVAVIAVATLVNSQLFAELQKEGWEYDVMAGRGVISWDYLYAGQPLDRAIAIPTQEWLNAHLSRSRDLVFDYDLQVVYYLYDDIEVYSGAYFDSPAARGLWQLSDPDALQHLRQIHATYIAMSREDLARAQAWPLYPHLRVVYDNAAVDSVVVKIV